MGGLASKSDVGISACTAAMGPADIAAARASVFKRDEKDMAMGSVVTMPYVPSMIPDGVGSGTPLVYS